MSAIVPQLLLGLGLVAVPVVLHLIMRQDPKRLEFPALRFIRRRALSNRRRLKLRHLLLLLLRCLVIALLAFALARVRVDASGPGPAGGPVAAVIIVDTSPRMQYRRNQTRLEVAREHADWLLAQLPAESDVAVLDAQYAAPSFAIDRGAAAQRIERLRTAPVVRPLPEVIGEAARLLAESDKPRKELYVLTDLGRASWTASNSAQLTGALAALPQLGVYVLDVGLDDAENFGLGDLRIPVQVLAPRQPLVIETEMFADGTAGERTVELHLIEDGATIRVDAAGRPEQAKTVIRDRQSVTLSAGESRRIELRVPTLPRGTHQGYLKIDRGDSLVCDDYRYFTAEVKAAREVLLAAPPPADQRAFALSGALSPPSLVKQGTAKFRCKVVSLEELGRLSIDELAAYDVVCLLDPTPLAEPLWKQLGKYAAGGGGIAFFLGRNANPVDSFNSDAAQTLLPGKLFHLPFSRPDGDTYFAPRDQHMRHPVLAPNFAGRERDTYWDTLPVYRYWYIKEPVPGAQVVIPYTDGNPALLDRAVSRGRVLTMTTPVSDRVDRQQQTEWNWLTINHQWNWPFPVLMNEMMLYLSGSVAETINYTAGAVAVLQVPAGESQSIYSLTTPVGDRLNEIAETNVVSVTNTDAVGHYRLRRGGQVDGFDRGFSVNFAGGLTRLQRITEENLDEVFGDAPYSLALSRDEIERDTAEGRAGYELFPYLIVAAAIFLALEHLVSSFFYRGNEAAEKTAPSPAAELMATHA